MNCSQLSPLGIENVVYTRVKKLKHFGFDRHLKSQSIRKGRGVGVGNSKLRGRGCVGFGKKSTG